MSSLADIRILVVDDDDGGRYVKAHTLARQGYTVIEAGLGQTALDLVSASPPDMVLLDVRLPDGNGLDFCRQIKAHFPHITVLQTSSALISAQDRAQSLEAGADSYLVEPIEPDELVAVTRAMLRMRQAEHALREMNESLSARVAERTDALEESHRLLESEQTGRREAENLLWHTQKLEAVGQLTGGIAHDFNNLLTVITGNLELLQSMIDTEQQVPIERQSRLITAALRAAEHGAQMTQQLLAFARRGVLQSRTIDLNDIVSGMTGFLRRTLGDLVTLEFVPTPGLWPCRLDPVQLEAAILNLAINARDAMPEGGRLRIELENVDACKACTAEGQAPKRCVRIRLTDTGVGMSDDVLERAFEPFFTTKNIGEGSGLGLSQVYGFVNQSGGSVNISSKIGAGTTVTLSLPSTNEAVALADDTASLGASNPGGGETILIVEDEEAVREIVVEMIEDLGYHVLVARDGIEALSLLRGKKKIDLLFSDVLMPGGITGVALATRARKLRKGLGVLLTSGYPAESRSGIGQSDFPLLPKPYRRDKLGTMLRSALDQRIGTA